MNMAMLMLIWFLKMKFLVKRLRALKVEKELRFHKKGSWSWSQPLLTRLKPMVWNIQLKAVCKHFEMHSQHVV